MKIDEVFRPLMEFERSVADLYSHWAEVFEKDREAAFVWIRMANEEKGHASLVDYQRRVFQKNPTMEAEVDLDLDVILSSTAQVRELLEKTAPPLEKAIALAFQLENSAAESHSRNALQRSHPEMERLLGCLGGEDRAHLERLRAFAIRRGIPLPAIG